MTSRILTELDKKILSFHELSLLKQEKGFLTKPTFIGAQLPRVEFAQTGKRVFNKTHLYRRWRGTLRHQRTLPYVA